MNTWNSKESILDEINSTIAKNSCEELIESLEELLHEVSTTPCKFFAQEFAQANYNHYSNMLDRVLREHALEHAEQPEDPINWSEFI